MVSRSQRKMAERKKLDALGCPTSSKSLWKRGVLMEALHQYIKELASKVELLNAEYNNLMKQFLVPAEVRVERIENGFLVRLWCEKGRDLLVTVLEAFEEMGVNVLQARVSCSHSFWMEAICEADGDKSDLDVQAVKQAILKALENKGEDITI